MLGGNGGVLGRAVSAESTTPDGVGRYVEYERGLVYWTPATGAWGVWGQIRDRYAELGWERSPLGYPVSDEQDSGDSRGRVSRFQHGSIVWSPKRGPVEVYGQIHAHWRALGGERGLLGHPVAGERAAGGGGRVSVFEGGAVFWTGRTGAREVHGEIREHYQQRGGPGGFLGYPVGDEEAVAAGRVSRFEGGHVYWSPATGAHEVHGQILGRYLAEGGPGSSLGFPVADERDAPVGRVSEFERGRIRWNVAVGATDVVLD